MRDRRGAGWKRRPVEQELIASSCLHHLVVAAAVAVVAPSPRSTLALDLEDSEIQVEILEVGALISLSEVASPLKPSHRHLLSTFRGMHRLLSAFQKLSIEDLELRCLAN